MAISYSFIDNKAYGTDDINNIVKNLVGGGIAPFPSKDSYSTSELNSLTEALVESGVCRDGCQCSITENEVMISEGIIYFENGVCLTVDSNGYAIETTPETAGYICAHFDDSNQTADIIFCTQLPTSGFNVILAELSADGVISDKRVPARSKIGTLGTNCAVSFTSSTENNCRYSGDLSRFNYALLLGTSVSTYTYYGVFDLKTGKVIFGIKAENSPSPYYKGYIRSNTLGITVEIIDGELYVSQPGITVILV